MNYMVMKIKLREVIYQRIMFIGYCWYNFTYCEKGLKLLYYNNVHYILKEPTIIFCQIGHEKKCSVLKVTFLVITNVPEIIYNHSDYVNIIKVSPHLGGLYYYEVLL